MRWLSRIVTAALILAIVAGGVLLVRASLPNQSVGGNLHTYALLRDGTRLAVGSPVVIAGVRVGEITQLAVDGDFARVDMLLRACTGGKVADDIHCAHVPRNAWITKRATSAFGDSYLEILLPDDEGAGAAAELADGEPFTRVIEGGSTDSVLRAMGRALPKIDHALDGVHEFLGNGRHWVDSAMRDGADRTVAWFADGKIESGLAAADRAMMRLDNGTAGAASGIANARPSFTHGLDRADAAIANARTKIADVKSGLHDGLARVRNGMDGIDQPIADYQEVVAAIDEGRGSDYRGKLGRLVNDHELGDDLDDATADLRGAADNLSYFKSWLGIRFEYNVFSSLPRIYATAEIRAHNDKYYLVEFERDSLGGLPADDLSDAAGTSTFTRTVTIKDQLRFTAQFGKQFGWLGLRGGIKDSTFGLGADALLRGGRLRLSADGYGGFSEQPRLKLAAAFAVFRWVYLNAGVDDIFTKPGYLAIDQDSQKVPNEFTKIRYGRDYFVGATLHFDDDDLATLLRVYGSLLVSAF